MTSQTLGVPTNPVATTAASPWPATNGAASGGRLGGLLSQSNVFDCGALSKPANPVRDLAELLEGIDGLRQYSGEQTLCIGPGIGGRGGKCPSNFVKI